MKKKILLAILFTFMTVHSAFAADQIKVVAMEEFKTAEPSEMINVKVLKASSLGKYELKENYILHCQVLQIVDPKRLKRSASFYVKPVSYTTPDDDTVKIREELYGKYSAHVLSKDELKEIEPTKVIKSAALTVGNYFVKGLSVGVSFVEGVVKNEKDNRLKSGVVNAYEASPLSYVEEGEQLDIQVGDDLYLVFKYDDENDLEESDTERAGESKSDSKENTPQEN